VRFAADAVPDLDAALIGDCTLTRMYLVDREIQALLPDLHLSCPNREHEFEPERQIQPCSIDLRLSNVFWRQTRKRRLYRRVLFLREHAIDLRSAALPQLDPLRDWKLVELSEGETLTIRPGEIVMGRVYERFRVPGSYAGKLEGRSSYARMGLSVHCTGDFINPGWDGFMPLQLVNHGPYAIRLAPYLSVCQLMLIPLAEQPGHVYGDERLASKYRNDDGGPSLWWRDAGVRDIQSRLRRADVSLEIQEAVLEAVRFESPDVIERFQRFVDGRRVRQVQNAHALLNTFARRELVCRRFDRAIVGLAGSVLLGVVLGSVFARFGVWHIVLLALLAATGLVALRSLVRIEGGYLTPAKVRERRSCPMPPAS
jgi:deoxycytidine triphosphate deaminase